MERIFLAMEAELSTSSTLTDQLLPMVRLPCLSSRSPVQPHTPFQPSPSF
jgi:hypothetical protein